MDDTTREALRSLITARKEIAYNRIKEDPAYSEVCRQQNESEKTVEALYRRFDKAEQTAIRDHYEGEVHKTNFELDEVYRQGLYDCFRLIGILNGNGVRL